MKKCNGLLAVFRAYDLIYTQFAGESAIDFKGVVLKIDNYDLNMLNVFLHNFTVGGMPLAAKYKMASISINCPVRNFWIPTEKMNDLEEDMGDDDYLPLPLKKSILFKDSKVVMDDGGCLMELRPVEGGYEFRIVAIPDKDEPDDKYGTSWLNLASFITACYAWMELQEGSS